MRVQQPPTGMDIAALVDNIIDELKEMSEAYGSDAGALIEIIKRTYNHFNIPWVECEGCDRPSVQYNSRRYDDRWWHPNCLENEFVKAEKYDQALKEAEEINDEDLEAAGQMYDEVVGQKRIRDVGVLCGDPDDEQLTKLAGILEERRSLGPKDIEEVTKGDPGGHEADEGARRGPVQEE